MFMINGSNSHVMQSQHEYKVVQLIVFLISVIKKLERINVTSFIIWHFNIAKNMSLLKILHKNYKHKIYIKELNYYWQDPK